MPGFSCEDGLADKCGVAFNLRFTFGFDSDAGPGLVFAIGWDGEHSLASMTARLACFAAAAVTGALGWAAFLNSRR